MSESCVTIIHDRDKCCFILSVEDEDGQANAILEYRLFTSGVEGSYPVMIDFHRTFVPSAFRGKGLAEKLVDEGLCWAKQEGFKIQASCWYVDKFL